MGHIQVGILDWECMACCFTSHLSYILAIFSSCIICSVPSPFHHPHVSTYYRNTEIVHLGQQKSHEHHVAVNSRCLKASMFTFKLEYKLEKEKECHRCWRAFYAPLLSEKRILLKASCHHLWKAIGAQSPIREEKKSIVIHFLVRGIDFPDKVHNILRVGLNHFLGKWHSSSSPKLYS